MPTKVRQTTLETVQAMNGEDKGDKMLNLAHRAIVLANTDNRAKSVISVREVKRQRELDEILEALQDMVRKQPETAFRYADKIGAMKLKAELDGHLKTHVEEKHLHLHGEMGSMSEDQLRKELLLMQADSSNLASGTPQATDSPSSLRPLSKPKPKQ